MLTCQEYVHMLMLSWAHCQHVLFTEDTLRGPQRPLIAVSNGRMDTGALPNLKADSVAQAYGFLEGLAPRPAATALGGT